MNDTFKKYELMKELGIATTVYLTIDGNKRWVGDDNKYVRDCFVAAILERACREWLEKQQSIYINTDDQGFYYAFYMQRSTDPITGIECDYDAAQIAALEYCLNEKSNGKESENENDASDTR